MHTMTIKGKQYEYDYDNESIVVADNTTLKLWGTLDRKGNLRVMLGDLILKDILITILKHCTATYQYC